MKQQEIENSIFIRSSPNENKLMEYGFIEKEEKLMFEKVFLNSFKAQITIEKYKINGKVLDMDTGEEYTNFRVENYDGPFINNIKEEYKKILMDIKEKCFTEKRFVSNQANRIADKLKEIYNDEPTHEWDDSPDYGVYRNKETKKWYALFMHIGKDKLKDGEGKVDVVNIKIDDKKVPLLQKEKGFYPAYHMNKKYWITIILDDTINDEKIIELINESYNFSTKKK